jgi:hypothetical protein
MVNLTNDAAINIHHSKKKDLFKKFARDKKLKYQVNILIN